MASSSPMACEKLSRYRNKCAFNGCSNTKAKFPGLHFFKFPVHKIGICNCWIENCSNSTILSLPIKTLNRRVVCEKHFTRDCFTNDYKTRLTATAVPTLVSADSELDGSQRDYIETQRQKGDLSDCTSVKEEWTLKTEEIHIEDVQKDECSSTDSCVDVAGYLECNIKAEPADNNGFEEDEVRDSFAHVGLLSSTSVPGVAPVRFEGTEAVSDPNKMNKQKRKRKLELADIKVESVDSLPSQSKVFAVAQHKWQNFQKKLNVVKNGSEEKSFKHHAPFKNLRLTDTLCRKTSTVLEEINYVGESHNENSRPEVNGTSETCTDATVETLTSNAQDRPKRIGHEEEDLITVLKKEIMSNNEQSYKDADSDILFLVTILSEVKKVPPERKNKLRNDILSVITAAQSPINQIPLNTGYVP